MKFIEKSLTRNEIPQVWLIDRSEVIHSFYGLEDGALKLKSAFEVVSGWPAGENELYTPILEACYDRQGWFYALFDQQKIVAVVVLDSMLIGQNKDQLQLKFLHVSCHYRSQGLGQYLFKLATREALKRKAKGLYISATPTENTVNFYLVLGCHLQSTPDAVLYQLEPEDIHLGYYFDSDAKVKE
jgi:predicted N-acetyltransferase YhbS